MLGDVAFEADFRPFVMALPTKERDLEGAGRRVRIVCGQDVVVPVAGDAARREWVASAGRKTVERACLESGDVLVAERAVHPLHIRVVLELDPCEIDVTEHTLEAGVDGVIEHAGVDVNGDLLAAALARQVRVLVAGEALLVLLRDERQGREQDQERQDNGTPGE